MTFCVNISKSIGVRIKDRLGELNIYYLIKIKKANYK